MKIYFTDFFNVPADILENYGAFNVSLINDLPLFIDPFLLFGSKKPEYQELHESILKYLAFLKFKSEEGITELSEIKSWYLFPEVKQNWFGYSKIGNGGSSLGEKFGLAMSSVPHGQLPNDIRELLKFTSGFEFSGLEEITFNSIGQFGLEEIFPNPVQLAEDGFGNFWILDIDQNGN